MKHYLIPNWPAPTKVKAYTTYRFGGHSQAPYESFNLSYKDQDPCVELNRQQLQQELQLPSHPVWLDQKHTNKVLNINEPAEDITVDATFTTRPGKVCVVMTADCLPVFICNRQGTAVAAIHAGWRGLCAGIIENTWQAMGIAAPDTLVWLGPAISQKHFEVGEEVRQQFLAVDSKAAAAFIAGKQSEKWFADLYLLAKQRIANCGIMPTHIFGGDRCTYGEPDYFYSYRRGQGKTGGMASLIWFAE